MNCTDDLYWHGLYHSDGRFKKYIDPKTFAHPAKMSMELCDHIFKHLEKLELLKPNDTVIDFMSGTGRTNIVASLHGYKSIGVELESHFIEMQNDNKKQVAKRMQKEPNWEIVQGDARKLSELLNGKGVGIMSPPYTQQSGGTTPSKEGALSDPKLFQRHSATNLNARGYVAITSPPYIDATGSDKRVGKIAKDVHWIAIGDGTHPYMEGNPNNIGNLKDSAVGIVSPPYADAISKQGGEIHLQNVGDSQKQSRRYGRDEAQIGNLPDKVVGITSPPYADALQDKRDKLNFNGKFKDGRTAEDMQNSWQGKAFKYSQTPTNIGNLKDQAELQETYLSAMQKVYAESYKAGISPLVTVTKNPTKKGKLRRLDLDTKALLEAVGYKIIDYHRAILWEETTQKTLQGGGFKKAEGRMSFFKRMQHRAGKGEIAKWEDIFIASQ